MDIVVGDLLTVGGHKYMTLEVLSYENKKYAFVNRVINEDEITKEYYIVEDLGGSVKTVMDDDLRNILLPKFEKMLMSDLNSLDEE